MSHDAEYIIAARVNILDPIIIYKNKNAFQYEVYRLQQSRWGGGVCLDACWDTPPWVWAWRPPQVWAWRPPRCGHGDPPGVGMETPQVWAWRPPRPDPSTSPLGVGLETSPSGQTPQLPPWVWTWKPARHAGIPPPLRPAARHAGIPPSWTESQTRVKT